MIYSFYTSSNKFIKSFKLRAMFGYLLVSNKNDVVLVDGDSQFRVYLWNRIEKEIHAPMLVESTSSGVYTDSIDVIPMKKMSRKSSSLFSMREVSHLFLPLISFLRGFEAAGEDPMHSIQSKEVQIQFKKLPRKYIMICIGTSEKKQLAFMDYFEVGLSINVGPLLDLIQTELLPVKNGRDMVQALLDRQCRGIIKQRRDYIEVRRCSYSKSQIENIFPLVKSLCSQLHLFLGSNRCILLYKGDIVTSVNSSSEEKQICNKVCLPDLHCLLDQLELLHEVPTKSDISMMWLRSATGQIPFYVNVYRCVLAENLVLVCLSEAKHNNIIRIIVLILFHLESIHKASDNMKIARELEFSLHEMTKHLKELLTSKDSQFTTSETAFLRNPNKTAHFFETVWARLYSELVKSDSLPSTFSPAHRFSLSSLRSAFSSISLGKSSSIHSLANNNGRVKKDVPLQLDVLISYLRRQATILLQEICSSAHRCATQYKLNLFRNAMKRILRPVHEAMFMELKTGVDEHLLIKYLRPVDLRLDMLAYVYINDEKKLSFTYIPEEITKEVDHFVQSIRSGTCSYNCKGKSGDEFTVYQITTPINKSSLTHSVDSWFRAFRKEEGSNEKLPIGTTIRVLFNSFVHQKLAFRQISVLCHQLHRHVSGVSKLFQ